MFEHRRNIFLPTCATEIMDTFDNIAFLFWHHWLGIHWELVIL